MFLYTHCTGVHKYLLGRYVEGYSPEVHLVVGVDTGDNEEYPGTLGPSFPGIKKKNILKKFTFTFNTIMCGEEAEDIVCVTGGK